MMLGTGAPKLLNAASMRWRRNESYVSTHLSTETINLHATVLPMWGSLVSLSGPPAQFRSLSLLAPSPLLLLRSNGPIMCPKHFEQHLPNCLRSQADRLDTVGFGAPSQLCVTPTCDPVSEQGIWQCTAAQERHIKGIITPSESHLNRPTCSLYFVTSC